MRPDPLEALDCFYASCREANAPSPLPAWQPAMAALVAAAAVFLLVQWASTPTMNGIPGISPWSQRDLSEYVRTQPEPKITNILGWDGRKRWIS